MGVYLVVEGRRSEKQIYGGWLRGLFSSWQQVYRVEDVAPGTFFILSGNGYPRYLKTIEQACADLRYGLGRASHLLVGVDAEDTTYQERFDEIQAHIDLPDTVQGHIIVQDCCIETWLLGNRKIVAPNASDAVLREYMAHYDVREADPERMPAHPRFATRSQFHFAYLKKAFASRGLPYTKHTPGHAAEESYLRALVQRHAETGHLCSFSRFCASLRSLGATL